MRICCGFWDLVRLFTQERSEWVFNFSLKDVRPRKMIGRLLIAWWLPSNSYRVLGINEIVIACCEPMILYPLYKLVDLGLDWLS